MARKKENLAATYEDLEKIIHEMMERLVLEIKKTLATKYDISEFTDKVLIKLDRIDRHFVEVKEEIRNIRVLHQFWAERHLSPGLMEGFLAEQEKKRKQAVKRVD